MDSHSSCNNVSKNEEISPSSVCDLQTSMQGRRNRVAGGGVCVWYGGQPTIPIPTVVENYAHHITTHPKSN